MTPARRCVCGCGKPEVVIRVGQDDDPDPRVPLWIRLFLGALGLLEGRWHAARHARTHPERGT